jgi:hypothetical protein
VSLTESARKAWREFMDDDRAQLGLGRGINRILGQSKRAESQGGSEFTIEAHNFDNTYGSNLQSGTWVDLAEYIVGAQTAYNVGYGVADIPDKVGRFYAHFEDGSSNVVSGQVRILTRDANDKNVDTEISGMSTSRLDSDANDWRKQVAVPEIERTPKVGEDSKIVIQFKLDPGSTGTTIDMSASGTQFLLDTTQY